MSVIYQNWEHNYIVINADLGFSWNLIVKIGRSRQINVCLLQPSMTLEEVLRITSGFSEESLRKADQFFGVVNIEKTNLLKFIDI